MNTSIIFDTAFKAFKEVRREWIQILHDNAAYINDSGEAVERPVAVINDPEVMDRLRHLQKEWELFYQIAESRRALKLMPLPPSFYSPIPIIAADGDLAGIIIRPAANTIKWHRDKVILTLQKKLTQHLRMRRTVESGMLPKSELAMINAAIAVYEADIERFEAMPEDTILVRRQSGYTDVIVKIKNEALQEDVTTLVGKFDGFIDIESTRVGAHGCVINGSRLKYEPIVENNAAGVRSNVYASIKPVPCALASSNVSFYFLDDVNQAKEKLKREIDEARREVLRLRIRSGRADSDRIAAEKKAFDAKRKRVPRITSKAIPKAKN
ncbi:hypothetical protein [Serratia silvae]|uniref:Uncharacterized protein n=1 Tax=Serratia silvae TaxID=2824122 RepID=A0ABT0KI42_9GAMM|nr:hypothetical protein [Serratia silvae]MCL1031414.1 hypothetical protein [Serratia silvae]